MFMVTQKEEKAIMGVESIYCSLQTSTEKVISALQYHNRTTQKETFWKKLFKKKESMDSAEELHQLLEALTILKSVFESNMPIVIDGKLFFRFRSLDHSSKFVFQMGEAQTEFDLLSYLEDLSEKMSDAMEQPEVSRAMNSSLLPTYCPAIARAKVGLRDYSQQYLEEKKAEQRAIPHGRPALKVVG